MGPSLLPLPFCFLLPFPLHPHLMSCLDQGHLPCMNVKPDSGGHQAWYRYKEEKTSKRRAAGGNREDRSHGQVPGTCFSFTFPVQLPTVSRVRVRGAAVKVLPGPAGSKREAPGLLQPFCFLQAHPAWWTPLPGPKTENTHPNMQGRGSEGPHSGGWLYGGVLVPGEGMRRPPHQRRLQKEGRPGRRVTSAVAPNPPADPTRQCQTINSPLLPTVTTWRAASQGGKSGCPPSVPPLGAPRLRLGFRVETKGRTWPPTPARPTHSGWCCACPTLGVASMLGEQKRGFEFYKRNK